MIGFKPRRRKRRGSFLMFLVIMGVIGALMYSWNFTLDVQEYELRFAHLPPSFDGYRIAVVSDLHAAEFGEENATLLEAVRDARPDIIALTGDITDDAKQVPAVLKTVQRLVQIAPVYYITGNHEWENGGVRELFAGLPEVGATVMRNDIIALERGGEAIYLVGLEDVNGPVDMEKPDSVFARLDAMAGEGAFNVTLVHRNMYLSSLSSLGADLILCGHAHGGLIRLPWTDGLIDHSLRLFPTHTNGVYTEGTTSMLVSRGVGNHTGIPRVMNKPHIPVAILKREG